MRFGLISWSKN